jgi:hypothetical protein
MVGVGQGVVVLWLEVETWVIGKSGTRRKGGKGVGGWRLLFFVALVCVFIYFHLVVVEGACVSDCRRLRVCTVGTVG